MNKLIKSLFVLSGLFLLTCSSQSYPQGKRIYEFYCLQCHMADGKGLGELYPDLSESKYLTSDFADLTCLILNGKQSDQLATIYMPAHKSLKAAELTNLINYMSDRWGNQKVIQLNDVIKQMKNCP